MTWTEGRPEQVIYHREGTLMEKKEAHMTTSLNCASHTANKVWSRETLPVIQHITYMVLQDTSRTCSSATAEYSFLYKSHCEQYCGRFLSWSVWSAVALASSMVSVWHHLWAFQSRCCAVKCLNQTHMSWISDKHLFCQSIHILLLPG